MNIAIIGNNDGPSRLTAALRGSKHSVVFVGLQRENTPDEASALTALARLQFDLLVNCFANFRYRELHRRYPAINIHLAPLPAYRGRHPLQWALINGERQFGATIHEINDDYDSGVIQWQSRIEVMDGWSARELREALMLTVEAEFADFLDRYAEELTRDPAPREPVSNSSSLATYVTRRYPNDSELIDWSDRDAVFRKVCALRHDQHPAYFTYAGKKLTVVAARRGNKHFVGFVPTTIVGKRGEELEVVCGDGKTVWLTLFETTSELSLATNQRITA